jgi:hypothetical protein
MTTVLIHHRVSDYGVWKREYDRILGSPLGSSVRSHQIWRGQDDPNLVVLTETYDSREAAEAALNNPLLPDEIAKAGVDMSSMRIDYLDAAPPGDH